VPDDELSADALRPSEVYRLMTDLIAPRPIAWVGTQAPDGSRNLAPFSYFQAVCSDPPTIGLGVAHHADGRPKDTLRNILATGELTISHVSEALVEAMHLTSGSYPEHVDEWAVAEVAPAPSRVVAPPRVRDALAAFECRLVHAIPLGHGPSGGPSSTLVIARIVHFHVRAGLLARDSAGRLLTMDPARLAAVGRLGGIAYTRTRDRFDLARPDAP
jgi:flavin reductase (DIM6/NTAB) family NADH-FMN oxidoreductase RutF